MLTLFCFFQEDAAAFSVDIDYNKIKTIDHLKKLIKEEKKPRFNHISSNELELWSIDLPIDRIGEFKNVTPLRNDETWGLRKLVENELTKECFASGNSGNIRVIIGPVSPNKDLQEITEGIQGLQIRWTFEERLKLLTGVLIKNLPETTAGVPDVIASIPDIIASIPEIKDKKETREGRLELLEKLLERMLQTSDLKWDGMAGIVGTRTRIGCKSQWHDQAKKKRLSDWLFQD